MNASMFLHSVIHFSIGLVVMTLILCFVIDVHIFTKTRTRDDLGLIVEDSGFWVALCFLAVPIANAWILASFVTFMRNGYREQGWRIVERLVSYDVSLSTPGSLTWLDVYSCPSCKTVTAEGLKLDNGISGYRVVCCKCGTSGPFNIIATNAVDSWCALPRRTIDAATAWRHSPCSERIRLWFRYFSDTPIQRRRLNFTAIA